MKIKDTRQRYGVRALSGRDRAELAEQADRSGARRKWRAGLLGAGRSRSSAGAGQFGHVWPIEGINRRSAFVWAGDHQASTRPRSRPRLPTIVWPSGPQVEERDLIRSLRWPSYLYVCRPRKLHKIVRAPPLRARVCPTGLMTVARNRLIQFPATRFTIYNLASDRTMPELAKRRARSARPVSKWPANGRHLLRAGLHIGRPSGR